MNHAAAGFDIKDNCQQTGIDFSTELLQICGLALFQTNAALQGSSTHQTYFFSQRNTACCEKNAAYKTYRKY